MIEDIARNEDIEDIIVRNGAGREQVLRQRRLNQIVREAEREVETERWSDQWGGFFWTLIIYHVSILLASFFKKVSSWWFVDYFFLSRKELLELWKVITFKVCCFSFLFILVFFSLFSFLNKASAFSIFLATEILLVHRFSCFLLYYSALDRRYKIFRVYNSEKKVKKLVKQIEQKYGSK